MLLPRLVMHMQPASSRIVQVTSEQEKRAFEDAIRGLEHELAELCYDGQHPTDDHDGNVVHAG